MSGKPGRWANINDAIYDGDSDVIVEDTGLGTVTINIDGSPVGVFSASGLDVTGTITSDTPSEQTVLYYETAPGVFSARVTGTVGGADLTGDLDVSNWAAIGSTAAINNGQTATRGYALTIKETFASSVNNGAWGLAVSTRSDADAAGAYLYGAVIGAGVYGSALQNHITGLSVSSISNYNTGMTVTTVKGVNILANLGGDNSTATLLIGLDVATSTAFGMAATSATEVMGIRVQAMSSGSGAFGLPSVYGVKILAPGFTSTGTKTDLYGLHIADHSLVGFTNYYNIFSAGSGSINRFEGKIEVYRGGSITEIWQNGPDFTVDSLEEGGGMIFRGERAGGGGADLLVMSPDGAAELGYAGVVKFATTAAGISITDGTATAATIGFVLDDLVITNNDPAGVIKLGAEKDGGGQALLLRGDPDGELSLYYAGVKKFETILGGISITDGTATAATIVFSSDDLYITNNDPDGDVYITAEKTGAGQSTILKGDPDGAAELYYAGTKKFETYSSGVAVTGDILTGTTIYLGYGSSADVYLKNNSSNAISVQSNDQTGFKYNFGGAAELYHAGVKKFETTATGVDVSGDIAIDAVPADGTASGIVITGTVDTNAFGVGALLMLGADGNWDTADADAEATCSGMLGLALTAGTGASKKILLQGFVTLAATWEWGTIGGKLYASTSVGELTLTAPVGAADIVRIVGYATSADTIYFDPDKTYVEV